MSEETVNPKKNIPLAIFLTVAIGGTLFTAISYLMQQIYPSYDNFRHADSASLEIALYTGGAFKVLLSGGNDGRSHFILALFACERFAAFVCNGA